MVGHITAHAAVGGITEVARGGKFGHGFLSAGITKGVTTAVHGGHVAVRLSASAIVGGTTSKISGGKFANGAKTASFQFLFNEWLSKINDEEQVGVFPGDPEDQAHLDKMEVLAIKARDEVDANIDSICTGKCKWLPWLKPMVRGTAIHTRFANKVRALGSPYHAEISYKDREQSTYGVKGSIRGDAVFGNNLRFPKFVVELKTGSGYLSLGELKQYLEHLPKGTRLYPMKVK